MTGQPGNSLSDLRGVVQLATDTVTGVTGIVEAMHGTIQRVPLPLGSRPAERTRGITRLVYGSIRLGTALVGGGIGALLGAAAAATPDPPERASRRHALAVVNGVYGDHLEASGNPLALPMTLRWMGRPIDPSEPGAVLGQSARADLLLLVHGLCLSDGSWQRGGLDPGAALAQARGFTPLHLSYNSGRAIARNGRELAELLAVLTASWPVPVRRIALVGHSMGGLLVRSACHFGVEAGLAWTDRVRHLAFLGTPHAGAPLERAGQLLDRLVELSPYSAPIARVGKARSAGITDLRHGRVTGDAEARPRLPPGARCHTVAALLDRRPRSLVETVLGDGLVPLGSALGHHPDPAFRLPIASGCSYVVRGTGHLALLSEPRVFDQLGRWLDG